VGYGDEDDAGKAIVGRAPLALAVALLSSTATPEQEAHGRFVESMAAGLPPGTPLLVLVDESAFVARFGDDATARRRRDERRQAWTRLLAEDERRPVFVDLQASDPSLPAQQLREAIVRTAPMRSAR
jgi:hypothetical protein